MRGRAGHRNRCIRMPVVENVVNVSWHLWKAGICGKMQACGRTGSKSPARMRTGARNRTWIAKCGLKKPDRIRALDRFRYACGKINQVRVFTFHAL